MKLTEKTFFIFTFLVRVVCELAYIYRTLDTIYCLFRKIAFNSLIVLNIRCTDLNFDIYIFNFLSELKFHIFRFLIT